MRERSSGGSRIVTPSDRPGYLARSTFGHAAKLIGRFLTSRPAKAQVRSLLEAAGAHDTRELATAEPAAAG